MRRAEFDAVAATIQRETAGEWMLIPAETIASRVIRATVIFCGREITVFKCYGQSKEWLYSSFVMLVKACFNYELAYTDQQWRKQVAA